MSRDASLHEKTVQKVARGAVNPPKRHQPPRTRRVIATYTVTVDPRVMKAAKEIKSEGIYTRIEIISAEEVIVR